MIQNFKPTPAATVNIDVSSSSQRVRISGPRCDAVRIENLGTATVWIDFGDVTIAATTISSMPFAAGKTEVLRFANKSGADLYVAGIAAASTGKVYFTPGTGN